MKQKYFLIPGRNPSLSEAELYAVCSTWGLNDFTINSTAKSFFILETKSKDDELMVVFQRLGGFIKFGKIVDSDLKLDKLATDRKQVIFGVSGYSPKDPKEMDQNVKRFIRNIKKGYKEQGKRSRYIGKGRGALSAGQITGSSLLEKGFELVLLQAMDGEMQLGLTYKVQDIEGFSDRDYEKPHTDIEMGVLPPKLARIMINLASINAGSTVWDPFCGSGTILLEGLILGYNVIGSDIDKRALSHSSENIKWLGQNFELGDSSFSLFPHDVLRYDKSVQRKLQNTDIDAIVFEPYMGPPQRSQMTQRAAKAMLEDIQALYRGLLNTVEHIKKERMTIVSIVPSYKTEKGWISLRYRELFSKKWELKGVGKNPEGLHWDRSNSIIRRNLVIARLKN